MLKHSDFTTTPTPDRETFVVQGMAVFRRHIEAHEDHRAWVGRNTAFRQFRESAGTLADLLERTPEKPAADVIDALRKPLSLEEFLGGDNHMPEPARAVRNWAANIVEQYRITNSHRCTVTGGRPGRDMEAEYAASLGDLYDAMNAKGLVRAMTHTRLNYKAIGITIPDIELTHVKTGRVARLGGIEVVIRAEPGTNGAPIVYGSTNNPERFAGGADGTTCHPHVMADNTICLGEAGISLSYIRASRGQQVDLVAAAVVLESMLRDYHGGSRTYDDMPIWDAVEQVCGDCAQAFGARSDAKVCAHSGRKGCSDCIRSALGPDGNDVDIAEDLTQTITIGGVERAASPDAIAIVDRPTLTERVAHRNYIRRRRTHDPRFSEWNYHSEPSTRCKTLGRESCLVVAAGLAGDGGASIGRPVVYAPVCEPDDVLLLDYFRDEQRFSVAAIQAAMLSKHPEDILPAEDSDSPIVVPEIPIQRDAAYFTDYVAMTKERTNDDADDTE